MFKLIRYTLTTVTVIALLAATGVIQFTEKGKESLKNIQHEVKTAIMHQIETRAQKPE